jgi:hypothetical protein
VIEVHVRDEHGVEARQVRRVDPWRGDPLRQLPDGRREKWIGKDLFVAELEKHRRVPDPQRSETRVGANRLRDPARNGGRRTDQSLGVAARHSKRGAPREEQRDRGGRKPPESQKYRTRNVAIHSAGAIDGEYVTCTPTIP